MFGIDIDSFNALGLPGILALVILVQSYVALKAISLIKDHVVPLAANHFKHVESAFDTMTTQSALHQAVTEQQIEVSKNQTSVIESQGALLRAVLGDIETRSKE